MLFIKRAKILSTRLYEFFESGSIDTIATSPDKPVRRTNQATFSDLRKSGIHKAFGKFVVHSRTVAPQVLASVLPRWVEITCLTLSPYYLHFRHVYPESGHVRCNLGCPLWTKSGHSLIDFAVFLGLMLNTRITTPSAYYGPNQIGTCEELL
jgi:hypothetical protein